MARFIRTQGGEPTTQGTTILLNLDHVVSVYQQGNGTKVKTSDGATLILPDISMEKFRQILEAKIDF